MGLTTVEALLHCWLLNSSRVQSPDQEFAFESDASQTPASASMPTIRTVSAPVAAATLF